MIMDATFLVKSKVADLWCRRQVIHSQPNNKRKRVMGNSEQNKKAIAENRKRIFSLDAEVMTNKTLIYASRSMIEENRLMILSNYSAAFMGNRQIANNDTDEIFENRHAILDNVDTHGDVEENFVSSQKNKASLDFLQHRSQLNSTVLEISEKMAIINAALIDVNRAIMESNQAIVDFNSEQIAVNSALLSGDLQLSKATPESNAETIENNKKMMADLEKRVADNREKMESLVNTLEANAQGLADNKKAIAERRGAMLANRNKIMANKDKIFG